MSKSPLMTKLSEWASEKALTIKDFEGLSAKLDKEFELLSDGQVQRKVNQTVQPFNENFAKLVLRNSVDDRGFGQFRSSFTSRKPSSEEMGKVKSLLDSKSIVFNNKEKAAKIESHILQNFIPDGENLRVLNQATGYISPESYSVDQVINHYAKPIIDPIRTELTQLEKQAELRDKANWLANGNAKMSERLLENMKSLQRVAFEPIKPELIEKQSKDIHAKALSNMGIFGTESMTLEEMNRVEARKNLIASQLNILPELKENIT